MLSGAMLMGAMLDGVMLCADDEPVAALLQAARATMATSSRGSAFRVRTSR
jgi:hypothetical protein